ncbi:recombinase family protein [Brevundimonas basaltis]|uniref:DNA invertase Pin-like site-specific DNA recombinase n=1 Tax=Brevundimonas basaltis TaxID=472166 RepID=A0A7W8HWA4_9CAUL|nr:recombinase family protein [Brevundimonas basaltis]MBB5291097.1 DNA invertase Pin-like site-specific DNA recombinase [Brevundimonas basaltis]
MALVAYTRVSTGKQQASGLGLEAQQDAIERYAARTGQPIIATFTEVESGAVRDRPQLAAALDLCRRKKSVLLIARLDRLSRSLAFIAQLLEAGVDVRAADVPEANRLTLQLLAVFAEHERTIIRERTRAAMAAAKARGTILGKNGAVLAAEHKRLAALFAETVRPQVEAVLATGATTTRQIADGLNAMEIATREAGRWHHSGVSKLLRRLDIITFPAKP